MFTAFVLALVGLALNLLRHLWVEHLFQRACRTTNPVAHVPPWLVSLAPRSDLYTKLNQKIWFDRIAHQKKAINAAWF